VEGEEAKGSDDTEYRYPSSGGPLLIDSEGTLAAEVRAILT